MTYFAKAPLVIVRISESGSDSYVYGGQPVPEGVDKDTLKDLLEQDLITKDVTEVDGQPVAPVEPAVAPVVERPAESGPGSAKSKWHEYAASVGVDVADDAEKDDIIAAVSAAGH